MTDLPLGPVVENCDPRQRPDCQVLSGRFVELRRIDPDTQVEDLYQASHGTPEKERTWTYLPMSGPFSDIESMRQWLHKCLQHPDFYFLAVFDKQHQRYVGMLSYCNIVPDMQRLELGAIWYSPDVRRSNINTESIYLLLEEAFDRLRYRRVEWKCDNLNAASKKAALRLGFRHEGVFRKHMIVNQRNRDTAWFAMLDDQWPALKLNYQRWLYEGGEYFSLGRANQFTS